MMSKEGSIFFMASMGKKVLSFLTLFISDMAVIVLSFLLAYSIRSEVLPHLFLKFKALPLLPFSNFLNHYYFVTVWIIVFAYEKLYTKRLPFWEEVRILFKSTSISFLLIMVMIFVSRRQIQFSRTIIILAWLLSLFMFPFFRFFIKNLLAKLNIWRKKLIILGANETGYLVLKNIKKNKTMGYRIAGFIDDHPEKIGKKFHGVEVIGATTDLEKIVRTSNSKDIIIALSDLPREKFLRLLQTCEEASESTLIIPQIGDLITTAMEMEPLGQILALNIKKNLEKPWNFLIKNTFDKIATLISVGVILPVLFVISAAIKLDSKGPLLFRQKRLGSGKKEFTLFKFRSMYMDGNSKLRKYLTDNPAAREEWEKYKKLKKYDPRVTTVGRIIRKYSFDELPQLFNVILGKMSLVGPRPYLAEELKGREPFKHRIAKVKPGITGLWQVSGRSDLTFEERIALDDYYIRNWTLWLDIVILLKSLKVFFSGEGAY
jgi:Undecaprenyl-phosphate galactose phosphotransferase WbaP